MRAPNMLVCLRLLLPTLALASVIALPTGAQRPNRVQQRAAQNRATGVTQTTSPLLTVHQTFQKAAKIMESALPIYDGHRHRAIELARLAEREIHEAALGAGGRAMSSPTGAPRQTPKQRAALIPKGANVAMSRYSAQQIAASNSQMQQGMQLLQQGLQQLQSLGNDPGNHMSDAAEFANLSLQAANKGLQFVGSR